MRIGSKASIQAVPSGCQPDLVQVGVVAVAGPDAADLPVGAVEDHVFALAEADFEDPPLPPGEDGLAAVLLDLEVGRRRSLAGSGWNQTRLPSWSAIIGPGVPLPW